MGREERKLYYESRHGEYPSQIWFGDKKYVKKQDLRYGENPHQTAVFYVLENARGASVATAKVVQKGRKDLSLINITDANTAFSIVQELGDDKVAVAAPVKHSTPSGVGFSDNNDIVEAFFRAKETDPQSIFGCFLGLNRQVDERVAEAILADNLFLEGIIAPSCTREALEIFKKKRRDLRVLVTGDMTRPDGDTHEIISVSNGILIQEKYRTRIRSTNNLEVITKRKPTKDELLGLLRMWGVCGFVHSNAVVLGNANQTIGIGAGQMSRIASTRIAIYNANHIYKNGRGSSKGSVMASDAFFPFPDSVELAAQNGVTAVVFPLGSVNDDEVIDVLNENDMAGVCTRPDPINNPNEIERAFSGHK